MARKLQAVDGNLQRKTQVNERYLAALYVKDCKNYCRAWQSPDKQNNQRTESLNNIIKEAADNHVTDQATIHEILETQVTKQQETKYIKVIYNMGEYRLAPEFEMFSVSPVVWSQKTPEQQQEHVRKALDEVRIRAAGQNN